MSTARRPRSSGSLAVILCAWLIGVVLLCGVVRAGASQAEMIASGAEIDYPPFSIVDKDGQATGFSVELMRAALKAMGREVNFRTGPWPEVRAWLERGAVDALPLVGRTPEREQVFDFTVPYMSLHGAIVVRNGTSGIRDLSDLKGKQVAVMKGDNAEEFLRREDRGIDIVTTDTFETALAALSEGRHDAVVIQRLVALRLIQQTGLTNLQVLKRPIEGFRQDFCFAVREGDRETLALLNEGLALVMADGTYRQLHARWFAALQLPTTRRLVVGGDHNFPPFEYLDETGQPAGFNVELTRAIAREMGLDIEIRLGPWTRILSDLEDGEIDALQGMFYSSERDLTLDFTQSHMVSHYVGVVRRESGSPPESIEALAVRQVVVQEGDIAHDYLAEKAAGIRIAVVDAQEDALRAVAEGRYDVALMARLTALYWIEKNGWTHLKVGKKPFLSLEYSYAALQNQKALLAQFGEGLEILEQSGEYRRIREKWMGVYGDEATSVRQALRTLALVLVPFLVIFLLVVLWSWSLRRQVARRTRALQESEKRLRHLTNVLRAIRKVNQIIIHERQRDVLLQRACDMLTGTRGYHSAWVALRDREGNFQAAAESGIGEAFATIRDALGHGDLPACCRQALKGSDVAVIRNMEEHCTVCSLSNQYNGTAALAGVLRSAGREFGILVVALPAEVADDPEEQALFKELTDDIAFALQGIEVEQERERAEAALVQSEHRLRSLVDAIPDLVWLKDQDGVYRFCNPTFEHFLGARESEIVGKTDQDFVDEELADFFRDHDRKAMAAGGPSVNEEALTFAGDGYRGVFETVKTPMYGVKGDLIGVLGIARDISERKKAEKERLDLEAQLHQAQRMESVGRLAGGVAHDFNNILSVVMGYAELALDEVDPAAPLHDDLKEIISAARRSRDITRQLLAFARKETIAPEVLDLNETVENLLKMLRRLIGEDIDLAWHPATELWPIKLDPSQVDQILANLCINARDAIRDVGKVTIETKRVTMDADYCADHAEFLPGDYVMLAVSDNGMGMDRETVDRIFEPFYTTKGIGRGTGLGLSTVYGIVKQNDGFINVYSEPGGGTSFRIYLPRYVGEAAGHRGSVTEEVVQGRGETVLVVEDDAAILNLTTRFLASLNYRVLEARTPGEAIALAKAHTQAGSIQLLITDVVMPDMNGRELAETLTALDPGLKTLFMSGYTANIIAHRGVLDADVHFIHKPFSRQDLALRVRQALEA